MGTVVQPQYSATGSIVQWLIARGENSEPNTQHVLSSRAPSTDAVGTVGHTSVSELVTQFSDQVPRLNGARTFKIQSLLMPAGLLTFVCSVEQQK